MCSPQASLVASLHTSSFGAPPALNFRRSVSARRTASKSTDGGCSLIGHHLPIVRRETVPPRGVCPRHGVPAPTAACPSPDPVAWLFLDASLEPLEGRVDDALLRLPLDHADHGHAHVDG